MENPCHTKAAYDAPLYQPRWNIGWLAEFGPLLGSGVLLPWKLQLTNTGDILDLMLLRIEKDWVTLTPKMRKPWNSVSLESWWFDELMKAHFLKLYL